MTEYEILDLIASKEAHMASQFSLYLTVISAYLVVAYLVGDRLTLPQSIISSVLFIFGAGGQTWTLHINLMHVSNYLSQKAQLSPLTPVEQDYLSNGYPWIIAMAFGVIAALYFMWSIRHPKTE